MSLKKTLNINKLYSAKKIELTFHPVLGDLSFWDASRGLKANMLDYLTLFCELDSHFLPESSAVDYYVFFYIYRVRFSLWANPSENRTQ